MKKGLLVFVLLLSPIFAVISCSKPNEDICTVTFYAMGGYFDNDETIKIKESKVKKGSTVDRPLDPIKVGGYTFNGWYSRMDLINEYDFSHIVNNDINLYGGYDFVGEEPFYFEIASEEKAKGSTASISFSTYDNENNPIDFNNIQYYVGTTHEFANWQPYTEGKKLEFKEGQKLFIEADERSWQYAKISYENDDNLGYNIGGNIMSLLDKTNFTSKKDFQGQQNVFNGLFYNDIHEQTDETNGKQLKDASNLKLPATLLTYGCYENMFAGSGITHAPRPLGESELINYPERACYRMFKWCPNINLDPSINFINANDINAYAFYEMFYGCSKLNTVEGLSLGTRDSVMGVSACDSMFCATTIGTINDIGKLLPSIHLSELCYNGMFYDCKRLDGEEVGLRHVYGQLPATTLAPNCYSNMFNGCMLLEDVDEDLLPATTLARGCYGGMFTLCQKAFEEAPYLPCSFEGDLENYRYCYERMFYMCDQLKSVKVGFIEFPDSNYHCTTSWLSGDMERPLGGEGCVFEWRGGQIADEDRGINTIPPNWEIITINKY